MPTISVFCGITIRMYLRKKEHNPPHIHEDYQDLYATFLIFNGEKAEGEFPRRAAMMVKEFILAYNKELEEMWETGEYHQLPPLE